MLINLMRWCLEPISHPSDSLSVGADALQDANGQWQVTTMRMSRSARALMDGWVRIPPLD